MTNAVYPSVSRRRLVLPEYFDSPFPASFGACQHCIRPLAYYYNISLLGSIVPIATFEDLYSWLEESGSLRVRVACKARCMREPPQWLKEDLSWDSSVHHLGPEDTDGLLPVSFEALQALAAR